MSTELRFLTLTTSGNALTGDPDEPIATLLVATPKGFTRSVPIKRSELLAIIRRGAGILERAQ